MHGWVTRMFLKECLGRRVSKTERSRRFGVGQEPGAEPRVSDSLLPSRKRELRAYEYGRRLHISGRTPKRGT